MKTCPARFRTFVLAIALAAGPAIGLATQPDAANQRFNQAFQHGQQALGRFQYRQAREHFLQARLEAKEIGDDSLVMGQICNWLGEVDRLLGNYHDAEVSFQRSLEIYSTREDSLLHVARNHQNLGVTFKMQGKFVRAEQEFNAALKIFRANFEDHPDHAKCLNNLGQLYQAMGQLQEAEQPFKESLEQLKRTDKLEPEKKTALLAAFRVNLGWYWQARQELGQAREHYQIAVQLLEQGKFRDRDPVRAWALSNLGVLVHAQGKWQEAQKNYKEGLRIRQAVFADNHPDLALSWDNLAGIQAAQQRWNEAADNADRARRILNVHASQVLVTLSDHEKLDFLRTTYQPEWYAALSLGWARRQDRALVERSAEWVSNGKAMASEVFAASLLQARDAARGDLKKLVEELRDVQQELAVLRAAGPAGQQEAFRKKLRELDEREKLLTRKIYEAGGHHLPGKDWVPLQAVRAALPDKAVLIDLVRLKIWDFKFQGAQRVWQPARYVAWVIPARNKGDVHLVDLGDADTIDRAAREVVKLLKALETGKEEVDEASDRKLRQLLRRLADLLLPPLLKQTGTAREWVLSPDSLLWMIPWAALPIEEKKVLLEKVILRYTVAGRHLVAAAPRGQRARPKGLIVADPDFNLAPRKTPGSGPGADRINRVSLLLRKPVSQLSFAREEAEEIVPTLTRLLNDNKPEVLLSSHASITQLKKTTRPRVLVLSTHGFYTAEGKGSFALNRCGLIFAGINHFLNADVKYARGEDDGLLLGEDIPRFLDLEETQLVVLSACQTAQGDVTDGEAVVGLRQAFQLAGARAVVATLWSVDDKQAALLTAELFKHLAAGETEGEALRNAQLDRLKRLHAKQGYAHPYNWASHTLTGP